MERTVYLNFYSGVDEYECCILEDLEASFDSSGRYGEREIDVEVPDYLKGEETLYLLIYKGVTLEHYEPVPEIAILYASFDYDEVEKEKEKKHYGYYGDVYEVEVMIP